MLRGKLPKIGVGINIQAGMTWPMNQDEVGTAAQEKGVTGAALPADVPLIQLSGSVGGRDHPREEEGPKWTGEQKKNYNHCDIAFSWGATGTLHVRNDRYERHSPRDYDRHDRKASESYSNYNSNYYDRRGSKDYDLQRGEAEVEQLQRKLQSAREEYVQICS